MINYGWRKSQELRENSSQGMPGLIRSIFLVFLLIFALGFVDGVTRHGDQAAAAKECPPAALNQTNNPNGSIDCTLKVDRDPAKVTRKVRL